MTVCLAATTCALVGTCMLSGFDPGGVCRFDSVSLFDLTAASAGIVVRDWSWFVGIRCGTGGFGLCMWGSRTIRVGGSGSISGVGSVDFGGSVVAFDSCGCSAVGDGEVGGVSAAAWAVA